MFQITKVNSVAECAALLNMAAAEQANLNFRKSSIEHRASNYEDDAVEIDAELQAVQAELAAVVTMIATLPEGSTTKDAQERNQKRLEYRLIVLVHRKKGVGGVAILDSELEIARIDTQLDAIATFITEVESRKAQL